MAFWSSHSGVPSLPIKHVKPFDPLWTALEDPSGCGMVIVALFTTDAGAAVFTLAVYSGSVFGISSLGRADADVMRAAEATQKPNRRKNVENDLGSCCRHIAPPCAQTYADDGLPGHSFQSLLASRWPDVSHLRSTL